LILLRSHITVNGNSNNNNMMIIIFVRIECSFIVHVGVDRPCVNVNVNVLKWRSVYSGAYFTKKYFSQCDLPLFHL